jgi:serralysin
MFAGQCVRPHTKAVSDFANVRIRKMTYVTQFDESVDVLAPCKYGDDNNNIPLMGTEEDDCIHGLGGHDALFGLAGDDWLYGDDGTDELQGGGGDDHLSGGNNDDTLYGDDNGASPSGLPGDDVLVGGSGNDKLWGEQGNDTLKGGANNDALYGGDGKDLLRGGAGADSLTGGTEADVFDFDLVSDSPTSARDWLMDFSKAQQDKLDLSGIDAKSDALYNNAFTFIGSSEFTGVSGQLRFEKQDAFFANTTVSGDVNGDAVADFEVVCFGFIDFAAADFIL